MSAAVLLSITAPAAPSQGSKAAVRAANDVGDFAAALEEAAHSEVIAATPTARGPKAESAEAAAPASEGEDSADLEFPTDAAPVPPQSTVPAPGALSVAVAAQSSPESEGGSKPTAAGTLAAAPPASGDEAAEQGVSSPLAAAKSDEVALRGKTVAEGKAVASSAVTGDVASVEEAASKSPQQAAEPAKVVTPVASDRAREVANARSAVITATRPGKSSAAAEPPPAIEAEAPPSNGDAEPAPAIDPTSTEPTRVRDVIDRALARAPARGAASAEIVTPKGDATPAEAKAGTSVSPTAPADASATKAQVEPVAASFQAVAVEQPAATPAPATTAAPEIRPTEPAQVSVLSTLSRAAVETTAQIAAQIVRKLEGRSTRFEMALTPDDLGRVDVSLDIDADGALHATLAFDNPVAASELRGRADELRRQLIEAGFSVADDALSFAERDPSAGQGGAFDREADPRNARAFGAASRLTAEADLSLQTPAWISLSLTPAGVDMKV